MEQKYRGASQDPFQRPPRNVKGPATGRCGPHKKACASISRVLYPPCGEPPSSIWSRCHQRDLATYPPTPSRFGGTGFPCPCIPGRPVYMVFQRVGFTKLPCSHTALVSSYLTFSPLPPSCDGSAVSLSAALSVAVPFPVRPLPVRKHAALCCPDFPPPAQDGERWSDAQDVNEPSTDRTPHALRWMITSVAPTP